MWQECSEYAEEQRIALHKSDQQHQYYAKISDVTKCIVYMFRAMTL